MFNYRRDARTRAAGRARVYAQACCREAAGLVAREIPNERLLSFSFQRFSSRTVRVAAVPPGRHDAGGQEAFPAAVLFTGEST